MNDNLELRGIVMTMFDARTNLSAQVVAEVREHFADRVYDTVIPRTVRLSEAPSFGKSILEHDSSGTGARAYRALATEFVRRHQPRVGRLIPKTIVGNPLNVVFFSTVIPIFSTTRRDAMLSG